MKMKTSCGALLYTYDTNGHLGLILGKEFEEYLPFKGCNESGETYEQTAIREIYEETCGLVKLNKIDLDHRFSTKRKRYYIGLVLVDFNILEDFKKVRALENRSCFCEKKDIKFFTLYDALNDTTVHNITKASIYYYWSKFERINNSIMIYPEITEKQYEYFKTLFCIPYESNTFNERQICYGKYQTNSDVNNTTNASILVISSTNEKDYQQNNNFNLNISANNPTNENSSIDKLYSNCENINFNQRKIYYFKKENKYHYLPRKNKKTITNNICISEFNKRRSESQNWRANGNL